MALVVEDGTGLLNSTSYVSLAEAADYFDADAFNEDAWDALGDTAKENLLKKATRLVDQYYDFFGSKYKTDSSLRWPRSGVSDLDGNQIPVNVVPKQLKFAVCELAIALNSSEYGADPEDLGIKEVEVDGVRVVFDKSDRKGSVSGKVRSWMRGLGRLTVGSNQIKVILA